MSALQRESHGGCLRLMGRNLIGPGLSTGIKGRDRGVPVGHSTRDKKVERAVRQRSGRRAGRYFDEPKILRVSEDVVVG
jgi:hypothetical protein